MIVLDLHCDHDHAFEGWFASHEAFADQLAQGLITCPQCGSLAVRRKPSAPYLNTRTPPAAGPEADEAAARAELAQRLVHRLREVARSADNVGEDFADEARRIHYGESEDRAIRGQASHTDVRELIDEGIFVLPVPDEETQH